VWFEARGWGASEGDPRDAEVGKIFDADLIAVLDAMGFQRPTLLGAPPGGGAIQFAARCPDRVSSLVLFNAHAHYVREHDYPWGFPRTSVDRAVADFEEMFRAGSALQAYAPQRLADERFRTWFARAARVGAGPDRVAEAVRVGLEADLRPLLPAIAAPTLVLHREGCRFVRVGAGRYLAEHIANAKFVALSGDEYPLVLGDTDAVVDEIEDFLTGARSGAEGEVVLAAVLFTDIVASTEQSARLGHRKWSALTDDHDAMVRATLQHHRGREVKTMGDGFLATFDATTRAVRAAMEIVTAAKGMGLEVRAGVHAGEIEVRPDDVVGLPVAIAKRVCDLAGSGRVCVTEVVKLQVAGSGFDLEEQGEHELKGVPGAWKLFAVQG